MALNLRKEDILNWSVGGASSGFFLVAAVGYWSLTYFAISDWAMWSVVAISTWAGLVTLVCGLLANRQIRMQKEAGEMERPLGYQGPQRRRRPSS